MMRIRQLLAIFVPLKDIWRQVLHIFTQVFTKILCTLDCLPFYVVVQAVGLANDVKREKYLLIVSVDHTYVHLLCYVMARFTGIKIIKTLMINSDWSFHDIHANCNKLHSGHAPLYLSNCVTAVSAVSHRQELWSDHTLACGKSRTCTKFPACCLEVFRILSDMLLTLETS
jgi:hypothetical protein